MEIVSRVETNRAPGGSSPKGIHAVPIPIIEPDEGRLPSDIAPLLNYLAEQRGVDFSAYRNDIIRQRIHRKLKSANLPDVEALLDHLKGSPSALNDLLDALTINFSRFFRDGLVFEYVAHQILPVILFNKKRNHRCCLRIWSAGCATGEEPYSMALMIHDRLGVEMDEWQVHIFATDIDSNALEYAKTAINGRESIRDIKHHMVETYFTRIENRFRLDDRVKALVDFSDHDILDKAAYVPPHSVYGDFDLVLCRNLLIYFTLSSQRLILERLFRSLAADGYLVLGMAETPPAPYVLSLKRVSRTVQIYQK